MAQAPIGANRPSAALCRRRIVPDPRRLGINPERGQIVAKMGGRVSIVNGALQWPYPRRRNDRDCFVDDDWEPAAIRRSGHRHRAG